ncbi:NUDIX hydrolase [Patescibacteria group bacterium]|nr:NUDIX hydrolase [Patescibacteria group bacterium]
MKILNKKEVYKGKYIKVIKKQYLTKSGRKGAWEYIKKKIYKRIVMIFALTKKKEVILERIFRVPVNSWVIELPAGLTDKRQESEKEAAKRELLEETGFRAKKLIPIFSVPINPASIADEVIFFFAPDVEFVGKKESKETAEEEIEVIKVPLKKLVNFLMKPPKNTKVDIKILSLLPALKKEKLI